MRSIIAMSLFSNVGIAETYLEEAGVHVIAANEVDERRAEFYHAMHPKTRMVCGDITKKETKDELVSIAKEKNVRLIIATPPCQGMSAARAGKSAGDVRNYLICDAVDIICRVLPDYVFFENVPQQMSTFIDPDGTPELIPDYLERMLGGLYRFNLGSISDRKLFKKRVVNTSDFGVPQNRRRAVILLSKKDLGKIWEFPEKESGIITMQDAIGDLPSLFPYVRGFSLEQIEKIFPDFEKCRKEASEVSPLHFPPMHVLRHVRAMAHTPTGKSAFFNPPAFRPVKADGSPAHGFEDTYMRQRWDKPACTVTSNSGSISSHTNVHPGRPAGKDSDGYEIWSDPRVLTIFELMRVSSLPDNWNPPEGYDGRFLRTVIGEGIPPLMVRKIMENIPE